MTLSCHSLTRTPHQMKSRDSIDHSDIISVIVQGELLPQPVEMTTVQFRDFYQDLVIAIDGQSPPMALVNLVDQAQVIFPSLSRQEIILTPGDRTAINREDFQYLPLLHWYGPEGPPPRFPRFVLGELHLHPQRFLLVFLLSLAALWIFAPSVNSLIEFNLYVLRTIGTEAWLHK